MIVRTPQNWFRTLFVLDGSVLPSIAPQLLFMFVVSTLALFTDGRFFGHKVPLNMEPFTLLGVALAIFLGFRNSASYDRYWEARKMWGNVLIAARALTSQVINYVPRDAAGFDRMLFVKRLIAAAYALKHQLRNTEPHADLSHLLSAEDLIRVAHWQYRPTGLLDQLRAMLAEAQRQGALSDTQLWMCDAQINELATMVGGCERIATNPLPFPYGVLLHRTVYIYCLLLPFGLVDSIGVVTPLISVFVSYTLFALEAIASELAEPFGKAPNHLALDAMTRNIERSLLELCGKAVPSPIPVGADYRLT